MAAIAQIAMQFDEAPNGVGELAVRCLARLLCLLPPLQSSAQNITGAGRGAWDWLRYPWRLDNLSSLATCHSLESVHVLAKHSLAETPIGKTASIKIEAEGVEQFVQLLLHKRNVASRQCTLRRRQNPFQRFLDLDHLAIR